MIQICDDMIKTLGSCSRYSIGILLHVMNNCDHHGDISQLECDIYHEDLRKICGGIINFKRIIKGLSEDAVAMISEDRYCTLFTEFSVMRYPLHKVNYLHVKINPVFAWQIFQLDSIGYSKVTLHDCLRCLDFDSQPKRTLLLYLSLCRKKFRGDFYLSYPELARSISIESMEIRNATRRVVNPVIANLMQVMPVEFRKRTYQNKLLGYDVLFHGCVNISKE